MKLYQLAEEFRKNYMTNRLRPSTMRGYNINLNRHILPCLGKVNVSALNVNHLDELTEHLKQKNLCNRSVVYAHATLRKMLSYALRRGYIRKTPYDVYDLPKVQKYKYTTLNTDQVRYILEHVSGDLRLPVVLALKYGMRRGEVLGLKWSDIDVVQSTVHVQRTRGVENGTEVITPCKTESGNRFILLAQNDLYSLFDGAPAEGYMVRYSPFMLDKAFKAYLAANNLPRIRFHDLRHSYATYMLSCGVNPKIVSEVLGHSSVDVTLDIYSHPDVSMQFACLKAFGEG